MTFLRMPDTNTRPYRTATEKQKAAARLNYALFQIRGMKGNLYHIQGHVPPELFEQLRAAVYDCSNSIERKIEDGKAKKD